VSDGTWDAEYSMRSIYKDEIIEYCTNNELNVPDINKKSSMELIKILERLRGESI
jgi:hypothetical protein